MFLPAPFESDQDARLVNYPVLVTFSRRLFRCVHFTPWSRRGYASPCRRIPRPSQPPRRKAFAVRAMNWMRKFELLVQRLRRRTFDSASKSVTSIPGDAPLVLYSPLGKSAEVRTN